MIGNSDSDVIDEQAETIARLKEVLRLLVVREAEHARLRGFSDCCCMALSRSAEQEYETGKCPHQLARKALNAT